MLPETVKKTYNQKAGEYIKNFETGQEGKNRCDQYCNILKRFDWNSLLDVGAGELTITSGIANRFGKNKKYYACDIADKKIDQGKEYSKKKGVEIDAIPCSATKLPYKNNSFDMVITSHCLEQMPYNYKKAIDEVVRVSKKYVILFEPSFKHGSKYQKFRMFCLNYARGVSNALDYEEVFPLDTSHKNRTFAHLYIKRQ